MYLAKIIKHSQRIFIFLFFFLIPVIICFQNEHYPWQNQTKDFQFYFLRWLVGLLFIFLKKTHKKGEENEFY